MKINGSLVFDASSASEIQNLRVEKLAGSAVPVHGESQSNVGRAIYVTSAGTGVGAHGSYSANTLYVGSSTAWVALATGGNAALLQNEVDAIETTLGALINGSGVFQASAFSGFDNVTAPADLTDVLTQLDAAIESVDTLEEIFAPAAAGNVIYSTGAGPFSWAQAAPGATSGVQAYDAGLTSIAGLTTAADTMIYTSASDVYATTSLTSYARTLLDDADAAAARTTLGLVIGTNVQAWDGDLDDIAALVPADSTFIVGNGTDWVAETGATVRASLGLTLGTDVQAYDADLAQLAGFTPAVGDFIVATGTVEGSRYGLQSGATARTSLGLGDIATMDQDEFIKTDGSSAVTANIAFGGFKLTGVGVGTDATDAVNLGQLDAAVAGLSWKQAVRAASTVAGGNLTLASTTAVDGVTLVSGDRVLVKNQTAGAENGIYEFNGTGLVRADDMNVAAEFAGATVFVTEGTVNQDSGWTQTAEVATVGTTPVSFVQFSGSNTYVEGVGIQISGNTISARLGAGIFELSTNNIGIELHNPTTGALILTTSGSDRSTDNASKLHLLTNTTQFDQDATGLFLKASGVTATELASSVAGAGLAGGAGTALSVNVDNSTIEIDTDTLRVKDAGITQAKLSTASLITLAASGSTDEPVLLGEVMTFAAGGVGGLGVAVATGNLVTFSTTNAAADGTTKGVATFASADFSATNGVVSAVAKNIDSLTNVTTTTPLAGHVLSYNGTDWVNKKIYHVETFAADTEWVVTHGLGVKFVTVTILDSADEVVIPQSILMENGVTTVTFNTLLAGTAVLMAIA